MTLFEIIGKMIDTVLFGGLEIGYTGLSLDYIVNGIYFGYLIYYIAFCMLTASFYFMVSRIKKKKEWKD